MQINPITDTSSYHAKISLLRNLKQQETADFKDFNGIPVNTEKRRFNTINELKLSF